MFGLNMVPEVGEVLSLFVEIFWPGTSEDVWGEVKAQVEALIDQKIAVDVYDRVQANLNGLNGVTANYLNAIKNNGDIKTNWIDLRNDFALYLPNFQQSGYELLLLPLFAQFANMYLAVLRDAALHGQDWGMAPGDVQQAARDLTSNISAFTEYANNTYNTGRARLSNSTQVYYTNVNRFDRQMTDTVLHFMDGWAYYDVTKYPNGGKVTFNREIYSDPYGSFSNGGPLVLASPPTQWPTTISVWAYDQLDAVQVTYPAGGGPGGVTQTRRMGDQYGGTEKTPHGGVFSVPSSNLVIAARTTYNNDVPFTLQFIFADYTTTPVYGGGGQQGYGPKDSGWIGYPYYALSSVYATGPSTYPSAESVVFGYKIWESPPLKSNTAQAIYITSPAERSAADLAKAFPGFAGLGNLITEELKAARAAYWAVIKARAK